MVKVDDSSGSILMCCQAGCSTDDICRSMGITLADLNERPQEFPRVHKAKPTPKAGPAPKLPDRKPKEEKPERPLPWPPTKVYHYTDEAGNLLFDVLRFTYPEGDKTFRQGIPDRSRSSGWSLGGVSGLPKPLYRLPAVCAAIRDGRTVYVVEGEKDV